ncbi:MAG: hypothetical protein ACK4NX_00055, partial [Candidatus Paceibacteria bacterium]
PVCAALDLLAAPSPSPSPSPTVSPSPSPSPMPSPSPSPMPSPSPSPSPTPSPSPSPSPQSSPSPSPTPSGGGGGGGGSSPYLSLSKRVRNVTTGGTFVEAVTAQPEETVEFLIEVNSLGGVARNVRVHDVLPQELSYVAFSTTIHDNPAPEGIITYPGLFLGDLPISQGKIIKFRAQVASSSAFSAQTTVLNNNARVTADMLPELVDPAQIKVILPTGMPPSPFPTPTPSPLPSPSPVPRVLGAAAVDTGFPEVASALFWSFIFASTLAIWRFGYRIYWQRKIAILLRQRSLNLKI